jgi:hypothetical protein
MLFVFVVLAIGSLALAALVADPSGAGTGTTQVIESGSDPFGADLPEEPPVDDSTDTPTVLPPAATSGSPEASQTQPRQLDGVDVRGADRPPAAGPATSASSPAPVTAPAPRQPVPDQPGPTPASPAPVQTPEPDLLDQLLGVG